MRGPAAAGGPGSGIRGPESEEHVVNANAAQTFPRTPGRGPRSPERVAIVHDWLTGMRGGEKVLESICELYPDATLHTLVRVPGTVSRTIESHRIRTSLAQALPAAGRLYRHYLPLFPTIVELMNLDDYDLVISSSHCAVKSVVRRGNAVHVCYCHSPMRYAWDQFDAYFGPEQVGAFKSRVLRPVMAGLARWDAATAGRVDAFLANSQYVAGRIRRYYNRGSTVVYPPIDTVFYQPESDAGAAQLPPSFLVVSALVPYKRVDIAVEACRIAGAPLKIVGQGPEQARLQRLAGADCQFLGWRSDEEVRGLYRSATAVLLPGVEDFGIAPVEAQACGRPVVALARGGACETVTDGETGVLVNDASPEAFAEGLTRVQQIRFDPNAIRAHALRFSRERFLSGFKAAVDAARANALNATRSQSRPGKPSESGNPAARENAARTETSQSPLSKPSDSRNPAARKNAASATRSQSRPGKLSDTGDPAAREDAARTETSQSRLSKPSDSGDPAAREDEQ